MKRPTILLPILTATFVMVSVTSCIREHGYTVDYILVNSSGRALELLNYYGSGCSDTATVNSEEEYTFFHCYGDHAYTPGACEYDFLYDKEDSVAIKFDDGKRIVYKPYPDDMVKNIYNLYNSYEQIVIDTDEEYEHYYEERFHITPDDYENATLTDKQ